MPLLATVCPPTGCKNCDDSQTDASNQVRKRDVFRFALLSIDDDVFLCFVVVVLLLRKVVTLYYFP